MAPPAAAAAFAGALLFFGSALLFPLVSGERPSGADEFLRAVDGNPAAFVVAGALQSLAVLLLGAVIAFLYRTTKLRRPQLPDAALVLAVLGPAVAAVVGIVAQLDRVDIARELAELPRADATKEGAEDLLRERSSEVLGGVGFGANLAIGFALVLVGLNAMRAGLLSRFMGVLGIIIGVLYVLPLLGGPQLIQLFWLGALGLLLLDRWPGGRGPAWETGEATPWPTAQQRAQAQQRRREEQAGVGGEAEAEPGEAEPATPELSGGRSSRKRKKRKR